MPNKTLLLYMYEIGKLGPPIFQKTTPLFQLRAYRIQSLQDPLSKIVNNSRLTYQHKKKDYNRILVLHTEHKSNARRKVLINKKRSSVIDMINSEGHPERIYLMIMNQINDIVPDKQLLNHLESCLKKHQNKTILHRQNRHSSNYTIKELNQTLFPYNHENWAKLFFWNLNKKMSQFNYYSLNERFINIQIMNLYKIKFSLNRDYLYQDMKDFSQFLQSFNFIRYFHGISNSQFQGEKYCERLIKTLKWRTQETMEYLLLLFRTHPWERFLIGIQDFVIAYEEVYLENKEKQ